MKILYTILLILAMVSAGYGSFRYLDWSTDWSVRDSNKTIVRHIEPLLVIAWLLCVLGTICIVVGGIFLIVNMFN